jgi:hypothetical protein
MLKRLVFVAAGFGVLLGLAFAVVWFVPGVQDALVKRGMVGALTKANALPFLQDKALHILLCGTGSPMPDLTRAGACAAAVKGFSDAYDTDADFRIAQGHELVPTEAARMIGHDIARPGVEEAVTVYDQDGLKISIRWNRLTPIASSMGAGWRW